MNPEIKIEGKHVLITGGASGLGAAYAEAFLKSGAENVAILDVAEKAGIDFAEKLNETYNNKVTFIKCDASQEDEIKNSFERVVNVFKRIDIVINNAGIMDNSVDGWRIASYVNWQGLVSFSRKAISHMRKDEGGSGGTLINISSGTVFLKLDYLPVYSSSKAAVLHFGRAVSSPQFNDNTGVRVLTMCLGATDTPLFNNYQQKIFDQKITKQFQNANLMCQSIHSAVEALLKMFREGTPGSVWISTFDQVGQDITSVLDEAYKPLEKLFIPKDAIIY